MATSDTSRLVVNNFVISAGTTGGCRLGPFLPGDVIRELLLTSQESAPTAYTTGGYTVAMYLTNADPPTLAAAQNGRNILRSLILYPRLTVYDTTPGSPTYLRSLNDVSIPLIHEVGQEERFLFVQIANPATWQDVTGSIIARFSRDR